MIEEQVLMWSHKNAQDLKNLPSQLEKANQDLQDHEKLSKKLEKQVEQLVKELQETHIDLHKTQLYNTKLQKEIEQMKNNFISQKKLLEYQQQLNSNKIEMVENKYKNLKILFVGLERQFMNYENKMHKKVFDK